MVAGGAGPGPRAARAVRRVAPRGLATAALVSDPLARRDRLHGGRRRADSLSPDPTGFDRAAPGGRRAYGGGCPLPAARRHRLARGPASARLPAQCLCLELSAGPGGARPRAEPAVG